jgi:hypothetical protein
MAGRIRDGQRIRGSLGGSGPGGQRRLGGAARCRHRGPGRPRGRPGGGRRCSGRGRRRPGARPYLPRLPAVVRDDPGRGGRRGRDLEAAGRGRHGRAGTSPPAGRPALGRGRLGGHHPLTGARAAVPSARPARAQGRPGPVLLPRQPARAPRHRRPGAARLATLPARLGIRAGHVRVRAGRERGLPAGRVARPGRARPQPEGRLVGARAGARLRDGRQPAGRRRLSHRTGLRATSPSTTGGIAACITWSWARSARRSPCTTIPSGRAGLPSGSTWWTRPRCCGGCRCSAWT